MNYEFNKFIPNIPNDLYHSTEGVYSSSQLKYALKDMNKFKAYVLEGKRDFPHEALTFGNMVHTYILENDIFNSKYAIFDDTGLDMRKKESKLIKADFYEKNKFKEIVKKSDFDRADGMRRSIQSIPYANDLIEGGMNEVSLFYKDGDMEFRTRYDYVNTEKKYIVDLKTAQSANRIDFGNASKYKFHYDLSAYMYMRAIELAFGEAYDFYFLVVEKEEPYSVAVYKVGPDFYESGKTKYLKSIRNIKHSLETKTYSLQNEIEEL